MREPRYWKNPATGLCAATPMTGYDPVYDEELAPEPAPERRKPGPKPKIVEQTPAPESE